MSSTISPLETDIQEELETEVTDSHNSEEEQQQKLDFHQYFPASFNNINRHKYYPFARHALENWFKNSNPSQFLKHIEHTMYLVEGVLSQWNLEQFLVVLLLYIQRYINCVGKLDVIHMFDIFSTSALVVIKFWEDRGCNNSDLSRMFGVYTEDLNINEKNFLTAVDYDLNVQARDINDFLCQVSRFFCNY